MSVLFPDARSEKFCQESPPLAPRVSQTLSSCSCFFVCSHKDTYSENLFPSWCLLWSSVNTLITLSLSPISSFLPFDTFAKKTNHFLWSSISAYRDLSSELPLLFLLITQGLLNQHYRVQPQFINQGTRVSWNSENLGPELPSPTPPTTTQ